MCTQPRSCAYLLVTLVPFSNELRSGSNDVQRILLALKLRAIKYELVSTSFVGCFKGAI